MPSSALCGAPHQADIGAAWKKTSREGRDYISVKLDDPSFPAAIYATLSERPANTPSSGPAERPKTPSSTERGVSPANPCQLAGLRAVTIHVALSIITDRSPVRPAKAARTAAQARARMSSG